MLEKIQNPADLSQLNQKELAELAEEIRRDLIRTVSVNGGWNTKKSRLEFAGRSNGSSPCANTAD